MQLEWLLTSIPDHAMQRYIIDTHIYIWYAKEPENLSRDVKAILDDKFPFYRAQGLELIEN